MPKISMDYVLSKIAHMKRMGLVSGSSTGFGEHGGACPDWLKAEQKAKRDKAEASH